MKKDLVEVEERYVDGVLISRKINGLEQALKPSENRVKRFIMLKQAQEQFDYATPKRPTTKKGR